MLNIEYALLNEKSREHFQLYAEINLELGIERSSWLTTNMSQFKEQRQGQ